MHESRVTLTSIIVDIEKERKREREKYYIICIYVRRELVTRAKCSNPLWLLRINDSYITARVWNS